MSLDNNKKPLVISINGGLGNQLFMLFAGISKAKDEKREYFIYLEENKRHYYFNDFLSILNDKIINYNNISVNIQNIYNEPYFHYCEIPDNVDMIRGYYQSYKYFNNNALSIINDLNINQYRDNYKINFKSIALHFRFGDYKKLQHYHRVISFVYYVKAIKYLKETLSDFDDYVFMIFGEKDDNDIIDNYIKEINFNIDKPINYIKIYERYPDIKDYEEFLYMSSCNHFIIANSTFSWFSAYISNLNNDNKIIIHPSRTKWFADQVIHKYDLKDLFLYDWIEIDF